MCVIFFYANSNPKPGGYKLILASNRDEFYARDTRVANKWKHAEYVYGGIDLEPGREGGTWLAIGGHNGIFKVGALLNLTGEPKPRNAAGRGMIVSDFVSSLGDCHIDRYNGQLLDECTKYSAFNFVSIEIGDCSTPAQIRLLSNVPPCIEKFEEGLCYGFGNSLPPAPFKKVNNGRKRFQAIVDGFHEKLENCSHEASNNQDEIVANLKNLLKCKEKFWPDDELLRRAPNWGEELSAINVNIPHAAYGSRTHSIILIDESNKMHFYEETMSGLDPEGEWQQTYIKEQFV